MCLLEASTTVPDILQDSGYVCCNSDPVTSYYVIYIEIIHVYFCIIFGGIAGKAQRDAASHGLDGIVSQEPVAARHALALLVGLARHNAIQLLEQHKELASLASGAASSYESSGTAYLIDKQDIDKQDSKFSTNNQMQAHCRLQQSWDCIFSPKSSQT